MNRKRIKRTASGKTRCLPILLAMTMIFSSLSFDVYGGEGEVIVAHIARDASQIENGRVVQKFMLSGEYASNAEEVGIVYSSVNSEPELTDNDVDSAAASLTHTNQIFASTGEVDQDTLYYARLYAILPDNSTNYSSVVEYHTPKTVEAGNQVGCEMILNGGYYSHDNGTVDKASFHQALIYNGFTAFYNGVPYQSGDMMQHAGYNSLITQDEQSGDRYLHVFYLTLGNRRIVENAVEIVSMSDSYNRISASFTFDNFEGLDCEEGGVLFSNGTFRLENGANQVTKMEGTYANNGYTTGVSAPLADHTDYYIRTYVRINGNYHYGKNIYKFTTGTNTEAGGVTEVIPITEYDWQKNYQTQIPQNCSAIIGNTEYTAGHTIDLHTEGNYYIVTTWSDGSRSALHVRIDTTAPVPDNIEQNEIFNSPVIPVNEDSDVQFYLRKDGGEEKEFANHLKIVEKGTYILKLIDRCGNSSEYCFEIKDPDITTQECFGVTTDSAEISANFVNNGEILERGFVYSSINDDPRIGSASSFKFVPSDDPEPGYITATLSNLAVFSHYYFRGFVKTGEPSAPCYTYGAVKEFTTLAEGAPSVMLGYPLQTTRNSIKINASVLQSGGSAVTERGLVYSSVQNPMVGEIGCTKIAASSGGVGDYEVTLTGLAPKASYFVKAYAINSTGIGYSAENLFSTGQELTVTFEPDGGTRIGGGALIQSGDLGFSAVPPLLTKSGANFGGWDKKFNSVYESMTVTALWTDNKYYQVTFDTNEGNRTTGGALSQLVSPGFSAEAPVVERTGYDFAGWDKSYDNIQAYTLVTAQWKIKKYNVYFDLNGGTRTGGGTLAQVVEYGGAALAPAVEKDGCTFSGWDVAFDSVTKGLDVTAQWDVVRYTVVFKTNTGEQTGGGALVQQIEHGKAATAPILEKEGYTFLGWDKSFDNVTENITAQALFAGIVASEKGWTTQLTLSLDSIPSGIRMEISPSDDHGYAEMGENDSIYVLENRTYYAKAFFNGEWIPLNPYHITNIDNDHPTQPTASYRPAPSGNQLIASFGSATDEGSGVAGYEYKIGKFGEWTPYIPPFSMTLPNGTYYVLRAKDNAGNGSNQSSVVVSVTPVQLKNKNGSTITRYVIDEQQDGTSIHRVHLMESDDEQQLQEYTYYPTNDTYKGCGVKAAQIFVSWFGINMPQGVVNNYVETTDFDKYIDWLTSDTWADPGIFTTPAQLDSGIQSIIDTDFSGYTIIRNSPDSSTPAIEKIEAGLAAGYPVAVLVNDGSHWQVISACRVTRINNDEINTAQFLVHDNSGAEWRTWSDIDYFFENNISAKAARLMGYDSYRDTIISVRDTASSGSGTGGGNSGGGSNNAVSEGIVIAPAIMNGDTANAVLTRTNISEAIRNSEGKGVVQITVNASADVGSVNVSIPRDAMNDLTSADVDTYLTTPVAGIRFDSAAMSAISGAAGGDICITTGTVDKKNLPMDVQIAVGSHPVFEFSITSNGQPISDFGAGAATVSVPYKPNPIEDINNIVIYYVGSDGTLKSVNGCCYDPHTGNITFSTNHFSIYAVGYRKVDFSDVDAAAWYSGNIGFTAARGLFSGTGKDLFDPEGNMTRAMFASLLGRLSGESLSGYGGNVNLKGGKVFADVDSKAWYADAVAWASVHGIISGISDACFAPNAFVTREQMAAMLYRYAAYKKETLPENDFAAFADVKDVSSWATEAVNAVHNWGIVQGAGNNLYIPKERISRAEAATVLANYIKAELE